jgi:hypothetical protein
MAADKFDLTTHWDIDAPIEVVWSAISKPESWPNWWRAVQDVQTLETGDANGIGAYRRMTWRTALPYSLSFNMRTVRVIKYECIEGESDGQLQGRGRWHFSRNGAQTHLRYDWEVAVTKQWMKLLAPVLRPAFAWNHSVVMEWGRQDLIRLLNQSLSRAA